MIAPPLLAAAVGGGEDGIHLRLIHIRELVPVESLERNGSYLAAPGDMFRAVFGDESSHGMNGRKTLVAGSDGASPALFEMFEEAAQHVARQVEDIEAIHWLVPLGGGIGHQQRECVTIAALRVPAEVAFFDQMIEEESLDPWT